MQSVPDFAGMTLGGRYHLVKLIGHGGMATVYEALDVSILKRVAVKVLSPHAGKTDDYLARFRQEALGAAQMKHPHLIDVTDFGIDDGLAFLVMELLEGEPLSERLDVRSRMLPWREAVSIILPVCEALAFAHERGLIHRDIKPGNIFLAEEPGRPGKYTVKLLDLGIAKALPHLDPALRAAAPETRATQGTPGTPEYMSPEQVLSEAIDHRVDIYALGVTLYRMLTGDLPFSCPQSPSPYRVQRMHVELPPVSLRQLRPEAQIPEAIEAIVLKALAKRPEERQSSAQELAAALLAAERAELGMPEPTPMIIQERGRDGSRTGFGPSQPRLLTLITVLSGFLTSAAVFMLCMLGPLPGVNAFANMLRGPEGAPPPRTRRGARHVRPRRRRVARRVAERNPTASNMAQERRADLVRINGDRRTYYAGAFLGDGLHEGAIRSGFAVGAMLGGRIV